MKKQRFPLLSARQDWISVEIFTLFLAMSVYAVIVWRHESGKTEEAMDAVLVTMRHVSAAILPMTVWILGIFEIVGETMIRFTSLMEKMRAEGIAEGKAEGRAEGRALGRAETIAQFGQYFAWEKRRVEAAANNQPFDEPPPPKPEGYPEE